MHEYMCMMCMADAHGGQKRVTDPLGLETQKVVSHQWVLGTTLGSFGRTASALNHKASLPAPALIISCWLIQTHFGAKNQILKLGV